MALHFAVRRLVVAVGLPMGIVAAAASAQAGVTKEWGIAGSGLWTTAANWLPTGVPGAADVAELGQRIEYTVSANGGNTVGGLLISNSLATLGIGNFSTLTVGGDLVNHGTVRVNETGGSNATTLRFLGADASITGDGVIVLNGLPVSNSATVQVGADARVFHAATHRIEGVGRIEGGGLGFENAGLIVADMPGFRLNLTGLIEQTGGGTILADGGIVSVINGAILEGGTIDSAGDGYFTAFGSNATVSGITNLGQAYVENFNTLSVLGGGITNHGTWTVNRTSMGNVTALRFTEDGVIGGSGVVELNGSGSAASAQFGAVAGVTMTHAAGHQIVGTIGQLIGNIINNGTIVGMAELPNLLQITGTIDQTGGGSIIADNGFIELQGGTVVGGTFDSIGTGFVASRSSSSAIDGVTNLGNASIENFTSLNLLAGGLTNHGTLTINRTGEGNTTGLQVGASTTIDGGGTIVLNGGISSNSARIVVADGVVLTHAAGHRIEGTRGLIDGSVLNAGTIAGSAELANQYQITGTITQTATGRIVGDDGFITIAGGEVFGGTFESVGMGVVTATGSASIGGVTNLGNAAVENFSTLTILEDGLTNHGEMIVNRTGGSNTTGLRATGDTTIDGTGTITLNATGILSGATLGPSNASAVLTIGAGQAVRGTGQITQQVVLGGDLRPSDPLSNITLTGSLTFQPGSSLTIALVDEDVVPRLSNSGSMDITNATLRIEDDGFAPTAFYRETISNGPVYAGQFSDLDAFALDGGRVWRVLYVSGNRIDIGATCAGDLNLDGVVDVSDLGILLNAFGSSGLTPYSGADANGDGSVDVSDLGILLNAFGSDC